MLKVLILTTLPFEGEIFHSPLKVSLQGKMKIIFALMVPLPQKIVALSLGALSLY